MPIPFYKPSLGPEEIAEVVDTLKSGLADDRAEGEAVRAGLCEDLGHNSGGGELLHGGAAPGPRGDRAQAGQGVVVPTLTFAATAGGGPLLRRPAHPGRLPDRAFQF